VADESSSPTFCEPDGFAPIRVHMHQVRRSSMRSFMNSRILQAVTPRAPIARSIAAIAIAALFVASCDVHKLSNPGFVTTIDITPNPVTVAVTGTQQFTVVAKDFSGATIAVTPTWSVVASGGAIGSDGVFTAGTTPQTFPNTVMATVGGLTATATVIVIPGPLASIIVTPKPVTLSVDLSQQFTALGLDAVGNVVPLTPAWSVVNAVAGSIGTAGLFTAGTTPGAFANTVKASSGTIAGTATVNVTAGPLTTITVSPNPQSLVNGTTQQYTAVGKDAGGNVVAITPNWAVVAGGGSIVAASGLFTAGATAGTFANTVQASVGSVAGFATVVVTSGALALITVTPNPVTMQTSTTQQFTAAGQDAGGNAFLISPVWSVASGGGSIDPNTGVFTAGVAAGAVTVQATSGSISGTAAITVTLAAPVVATITVVPNPASMLPNASQQFAAIGKDISGNVVGITPVWSVVASGGTINTTGLFTAGATTGTFPNTVQATSGGKSGTATVNVVAGALASITVTPNPVSMQTNGTQQFTAVGKDAGGQNVVITPVWSVVNGGGTINPNTGAFTAGGTAGTFINTVQATSGSVSGNATVIVTAVVPTLATITVTPNPATMSPNATQQFAAVGRDAGGTILPIAPVWTVVNGGGSINAVTGLFTAGPFAGTFTNTVKATSGAVSGTATVNVTAPAPPPPIADLKTAALNGIMAGTAFTCVIGGVINADIAISPGSTVTGFPPCVITGTQHLNDAIAIQNQLDLTGAYNTLAGLPCSAANTIGTTDIGGTTKAAGVYCSASSIGVTGTLTLDGGGDPNANFVFQAGSGLTTAGNVVLINGAQAKNVWWQVGSSATIGTASQWKGNIVALTSITLVDNATLIGRALARNGAVSQGTNNVIILP
jgi:Ice-binding-like/Bacterial Ig-like domain (group 2)